MKRRWLVGSLCTLLVAGGTWAGAARGDGGIFSFSAPAYGPPQPIPLTNPSFEVPFIATPNSVIAPSGWTVSGSSGQWRPSP